MIYPCAMRLSTICQKLKVLFEDVGETEICPKLLNATRPTICEMTNRQLLQKNVSRDILIDEYGLAYTMQDDCQLRHQLRLDSERADHAVYTKQSSTYDTYCV